MLFMSPLVTSLLMLLLNLYLDLASVPYVTRLVLFLAHHLEGAYYSIKLRKGNPKYTMPYLVDGEEAGQP